MEEERAEQVRTGPPWEDREAHGPLVAFAKTMEESSTKAPSFFQNLRPTGNVMDAALYGIGIVLITALVQLIWSAIIVPIPFFLFGKLGGVSFPEVATLAAISWARFLFTPVIAVIAFMLLAGAFHLGLSLLGHSKYAFETSFRIMCYSTAPLLLSLVPFCGDFAGKIWMIVLLVIGIKTIHETSLAVAIGIVILPLLILFGCCGMMLGVPIIFG